MPELRIVRAGALRAGSNVAGGGGTPPFPPAREGIVGQKAGDPHERVLKRGRTSAGQEPMKNLADHP